LVPDPNVCGVGSDNIRRWLPRFNIPREGSMWDSYGLKAVSKVFRRGLEEHPDVGRREITEVLSGLRGSRGDGYGAFITNQSVLFLNFQDAGLCP
jgi:hypothetical protein